MRAIPLLLVVASTCVAGCALPDRGITDRYARGHLLRWDHPWHGVPARAGFYVGGAVSTVVLTPLAFVEALVTGKTRVHTVDGIGNVATSHAAGWSAYVLGGPFYVLGLPFESGEDPGGPEDAGEADLERTAVGGTAR